MRSTFILCDVFSSSLCTGLKPELFYTCDFVAFMALHCGVQDCFPARFYFVFLAEHASLSLSLKREIAGALVNRHVFL